MYDPRAYVTSRSLHTGPFSISTIPTTNLSLIQNTQLFNKKFRERISGEEQQAVGYDPAIADKNLRRSSYRNLTDRHPPWERSKSPPACPPAKEGTVTFDGEVR